MSNHFPRTAIYKATWWLDGTRCGISSAVVVGDRYYLVDAGAGGGPQIRRARLGNWQSRFRGPLDALSGVRA